MSNHGTVCQIFIQGSIFLKSCVVTVKVAANGTAIEGVCVTSAANRPVICPVRPGHCPGSKLVWRGICFCHVRQKLIYDWDI